MGKVPMFCFFIDTHILVHTQALRTVGWAWGFWARWPPSPPKKKSGPVIKASSPRLQELYLRTVLASLAIDAVDYIHLFSRVWITDNLVDSSPLRCGCRCRWFQHFISFYFVYILFYFICFVLFLFSFYFVFVWTRIEHPIQMGLLMGGGNTYRISYCCCRCSCMSTVGSAHKTHLCAKWEKICSIIKERCIIYFGPLYSLIQGHPGVGVYYIGPGWNEVNKAPLEDTRAHYRAGMEDTNNTYW